MKKLLSIMLVLLMAMSVFACTGTTPEAPVEPTEAPAEQPTEAPVEPTEAPVEPTVEYEGLALKIQNKSDKTVNEFYIYPVGGEKGNSVVAAGWKNKDADKESYEQMIYIVREKEAEMEAYVVFEDGADATYPLGKLVMYDELSIKEGKLEVEPEDDPEDIAAMNLAAAVGKTADTVYPGYVVMPIELKNKTKKNLKSLYFYEDGADPKTYNDLIDYLYDKEGNKLDEYACAAKNGEYIFKCFIRPYSELYYLDVVFEDDTTLTYTLEDWWKPTGEGAQNNEIKLSDAEDALLGIAAQYDDNEKDAIPYLAEALAKGLIADQWYPTYPTAVAVEADAAAVEAAKAELAKIPVPASDTTGDIELPALPSVEPEAEAGKYTALGLKFKNKYGKGFAEAYIYPVGEDKGANVLSAVLPTEGEGEEDSEEVILFIYRETAKLGAMAVTVVTVDGEVIDWVAPSALGNNYKITVKSDINDWSYEEITKEKDLNKIAEFVALGVTSDGFVPAQ